MGKYDSFLQLLCDFLDIAPKGPAIEIGCGSSPWASSLSKELIQNYRQLDIAELDPAIRLERAPKGLKFEIIDKNLGDADLPKNHYNYLFSIAAFEHIHNFDVALEQMHDILSPGGLLVTIFGPIWQ